MSSWRDRVAADTVLMIDTLSNTNRNVDKMSETQTHYYYRTILSTVIFIIYVLIFIWFQSEKEHLFIIATFFNNIIHMMLIIIPLYFYYRQQDVKSKAKKEKEKLESLRLEVIDHLKNTWFKNAHSSDRDEISREMAEENINLRYKGNYSSLK